MLSFLCLCCLIGLASSQRTSDMDDDESLTRNIEAKLQMLVETQQSLARDLAEVKNMVQSLAAQDGGSNATCSCQVECRQGWIQIGESCYLISSSQMTKPSAIDFCKGFGSRLVQFETLEELLALSTHIPSSVDNVIVGATKVFQQAEAYWDECYTTDTSCEVPVEMWIEGQLSESWENTQQEPVVYLSAREAGLGDHGEYHSAHFVCEHDRSRP